MKMGMELEAIKSVSRVNFSEGFWRHRILTALLICPLQVVDENLLFVKVHMPWDVLCTYAEVLHIKLPIQPNDLSSRPSPWRFFSCITKHFYPNEALITKETEFFTAPFEKDRLDYFYVRDRDVFFTSSMRSRMASGLMSRQSVEAARNFFFTFQFYFKGECFMVVDILCSQESLNSC